MQLHALYTLDPEVQKALCIEGIDLARSNRCHFKMHQTAAAVVEGLVVQYLNIWLNTTNVEKKIGLMCHTYPHVVITGESVGEAVVSAVVQ